MNRFDECFSVAFKETDDLSFPAKLGEIQIIPAGEVIPYDGEYTVTPKVKEQVLATENKLMKEDVKIKAIPYYEVSNQSGGKTVYIAKEI